MTSAPAPGLPPAPPANAPGVDDRDLTARARIRDAALVRFAEDGVAGTSLKAIAGDAGVSPPLVIHHFGSKEGLRVACDEHVAALVRAQKRAAMTGGSAMDPIQLIRESAQGPPLLRYLARTLADGSPHVAELIDEMVEDAVAYMAEGVEHGVVRPSEYPRERAAVLVLWMFGALVLHDHAERLLGVDLTAERPEDLLGWLLPAGEILAKGVIEEDYYRRLSEGARAVARQQQAGQQERTGT